MANTFTGDLDKIIKSYEITSALNSLKGTSAKKPGKSGIDATDVDDLEDHPFSFNDNVFGRMSGSSDDVPSFESSDSKDEAPMDVKTLFIEKGVAVATLIKTVSNGIMPESEMAQLDDNAQSEVKFFSIVMLALRLLEQTGVLKNIVSYIKDAIDGDDDMDDTNLTPYQKHNLLESTLLDKMETEILPLVDSQIPGGINTMKFVLDAIANQSQPK